MLRIDKILYLCRFQGVYNPDAYTRLLLEALRGNQQAFVRTDELLTAWKIFTPLLHEIEKATHTPGEVSPETLLKARPIPYRFGSRGPAEGDAFIEQAGMMHYRGGYVWNKDSA